MDEDIGSHLTNSDLSVVKVLAQNGLENGINMLESSIVTEDAISNEEMENEKLSATDELDSALEQPVEGAMTPSEIGNSVTADSEGNYACSVCEKKYGSKNHLKRHISIVHLKIKKFPCSVCGKRFHSSQPLRIHMRIHTGEKPCQCEECGKAFSDPSALRNHIKMHNRLLGVMCDICGRYMATQNSLRNHKRRHEEQGHDKSMFHFQCPECSLNFCSKADLECHFSEHQGIKVYACHECPKSYKNFQSYQYHRRTHTGEKPFKCNECGNFYRSWNLLKLHSVVHKDPKDRPRFHCDQCGKDYSLVKTLNFHSCKGTYPCWICKTMFPTSDELREHKLTHSIEERRKYLCKVCGRRFSKSHVLKNHKCKILVVVDYVNEPKKFAEKSDSVGHELDTNEPNLDDDESKSDEDTPCEFHIDLCKFICKEDDGNDSDSNKSTASTESSASTDLSASTESCASSDASDTESHVMEICEGENDAPTVSQPFVTDDRTKQVSALKTEFYPAKTSPTVTDFVVSEKLNSLDEGSNSLDQLELEPTCILNRSCQKCGGDIDKDVKLSRSRNSMDRVSHICPPLKKKNSGTKKFLPLRRALVLKSASRKKLKQGARKPR